MQKKYVMFFIALVLAVGLDQGSKIWARSHLKPIYPESQVVVSGYFDMRYSENPGSAFSLFGHMEGARWILLLVGIGALGVVGRYLYLAPGPAGRMGGELGLLAGGALGNMIDRAMMGRVTDFIVWKVAGHEWPTFNIADAALVIGVAGLLLDTLPQKQNTQTKDA
jgi:signal peptidase II